MVFLMVLAYSLIEDILVFFGAKRGISPVIVIGFAVIGFYIIYFHGAKILSTIRRFIKV